MADYRSMFDRRYIGAWDLAGPDGNPRDVTVEISDVKAETLQNRSGSNKKPVIYFKGADKAFALNKSNGAVIAGMYGNNTKDWIGKRITLYPTQVQFGPNTVDAIRVRPKIPTGSPSGIASRESTPEQAAKLDEARQAAEKAS